MRKHRTMKKPWYQSLTILGGALLGIGTAIQPLLGPQQQQVAAAALQIGQAVASDSMRVVAQHVQTSSALPALVQGIGLALGAFGLRKAIAANGSGK